MFSFLEVSEMFSPKTNKQGVRISVNRVAKAKPPAMALESCPHQWVEGEIGRAHV